MLRSVVVSACMRACLHVCCTCAEEPLWNTNCLAAVSVTDLCISETADRERTLPFYAYTVYIYMDGLWGKNKKQVLFTRWMMVALPTLDENHVWLHLITAKSFHMAAVCSESVMFLNINTWFLRSALFFPLHVSVQPPLRWYIDLLRLTGLAVWLVNILPLRYNRVD